MPGVNDWLKKASSDLKSAIKLVDDDDTVDTAIYLTHQCTEKALKAFLVFVKQPIPRTHNLTYLLMCCAEFDQDFALFQNECKILNPYGHDSRYPDDYFSVDQQDLTEAIVMAKKILNFITQKLQKNEFNISVFKF